MDELINAIDRLNATLRAQNHILAGTSEPRKDKSNSRIKAAMARSKSRQEGLS